MATGASKNKWDNGSEIIISGHHLHDSDVSFEISYEGKTSEKDIITKNRNSEFDEIFSAKKNETLNSLYYGDNIDVLLNLINTPSIKGKINLIYIDPPYGTNSNFHTRSSKDSYKDDLNGAHFLEFMRQRLVLMRELLSENGSIYVHLDDNMAFPIKLIMDEVFGVKNFRNFITRKKCSNKNYTKNTYGNICDYILFYTKTSNYIWNRPVDSWTDEKILKEYTNVDEKTGRRYKKVPIHAPGTRNGETGKAWKGMLPPPGKHWQFTPQKLDEFDKNGDIYWSPTGNPRRKVFLDKDGGIPIQDIWDDAKDSINQNIKITGYPTEKNPFLIERIIKASSNEGDLVLDCFVGSGTTLQVANDLNRNWIGVDNSSVAIEHIFKRFFYGVDEMGDFVNKKNSSKVPTQVKLFNSDEGITIKPERQFLFSFYSDNKVKEIATTIAKKWYSENSAEKLLHFA